MRPDLDRRAVCRSQVAVPNSIVDGQRRGNRPHPETGTSALADLAAPSPGSFIMALDDLAGQWTMSPGPGDKCHPRSRSPLWRDENLHRTGRIQKTKHI